MNKITFTNSCSVPSWMPDYKKKFRENANDYFRGALEQVPFLKNTDLEVTYFLQGVGSIVAKIVTSTGDTYVMKTTESVNHTNAEICTYKAALDNAIKVPKLFFDGIQDGLPFLLIEYFEEKTLYEKLEAFEFTLEEIAEIRANFFISLKKIKGKGYNWPVTYVDGVLHGNFETLQTFMDEWFCKEDFIEIANKHFPLIQWKENLYHHVENVLEQNISTFSTLGTFDIQAGHIFASTPPTLFDPCLKLEPEYFDLAQLIIPLSNMEDRDVYMNKVIFSKYLKEIGTIDFNRLSSALWLQTYRKATNQLKHTDDVRTRNGLHALATISNAESLKNHVEYYLS